MPKCDFNKVALHGCSPVNLLHIFRTPFSKNTATRLLPIDVTLASPTAFDHHVTSEPQHIRESQNGERSNAEHNSRWKHDYKSNREKKTIITKKKKSKQDILPTDANNKINMWKDGN